MESLTREQLESIYDTVNVADNVSQSELSKADPKYDDDVKKIYQQAHLHRDRLIDFYIKYITCFTGVIIFLIVAQAMIRIFGSDRNFEVMPQWTLDILVGGMFGQFIVLLKIVTQNAWNYKSFFDHHNVMRTRTKEDAQKEDEL